MTLQGHLFLISLSLFTVSLVCITHDVKIRPLFALHVSVRCFTHVHTIRYF